ncbi:MAG: M23 family metallopeptidase [Bacteroidetes bacterium]|nr:M23 family metallopeptidase [Bacteroidota bacterium]
MRFSLFILAMCCFLRSTAHAQQLNTDRSRSNFVYELPTEKGKKVFISQGYNGWFSHKKQFALDFKLKEGSPIYAAREGVVFKCASHNTEGGMNKKYLSKGNHIIIQHGDGTYAAYWHLQYNGVSVKKGEQVITGQQIGFSGNTGYSSSPHLHFEVYFYNDEGRQVTFPTQFKTSKGVEGLKVYKFYSR